MTLINILLVIPIPLCIVLPEISGYIKYFENGGKDMLFNIEDQDVYLKYSEIWNKINSILNAKLP